METSCSSHMEGPASPETHVFFVVNPMSKGGSAGKKWPPLFADLQGIILRGEGTARCCLRVWTLETSGPGDATQLVRQKLREYADPQFQPAASLVVMVAVGGDGTINEVANGFFHPVVDLLGPPEELGRLICNRSAMACFNFGTGGDFTKTVPCPQDMEELYEMLAEQDPTLMVDVGLCTFVPLDSEEVTDCYYTMCREGECDFEKSKARAPESRYFVNVATAGMAAETCFQAEKVKGCCCGGKIAYYWAIVKSLYHFRNKDLLVKLDGGEPRLLEQVSCFSCGNGCYFGDGLPVCPSANPIDGKLTTTVWTKARVRDFIFNTRAMYSGDHVKADTTVVMEGKKFEVSSQREENLCLVEADGEILGRLPATYQVLPERLPILTPALHKLLQKFQGGVDRSESSLRQGEGYESSSSWSSSSCHT